MIHCLSSSHLSILTVTEEVAVRAEVVPTCYCFNQASNISHKYVSVLRPHASQAQISGRSHSHRIVKSLSGRPQTCDWPPVRANDLTILHSPHLLLYQIILKDQPSDTGLIKTVSVQILVS
ncbi:unnamed protein product [Pleuronectes platessa]|uniref:Uncharacterized protein n=1 Tax=Pleuronectes platessa TaxID=8262 RepID=A0A9N7Z1B0_PLEPL|nr:unnamed protein product [Pleuronectes platessa]